MYLVYHLCRNGLLAPPNTGLFAQIAESAQLNDLDVVVRSFRVSSTVVDE